MNGNSADGPGLAAVADRLEAPYGIEHHRSIGSTNERARELAGDGARNVVVLADEQTRGRGRRDRSWIGPSGGVYASILIAPDRPPADAPLFTLAGAVATADACRAVGVDAAIKWPNDVVVPDEVETSAGDEVDTAVAEDAPGESDITTAATSGRGGAKLAGVLTETESEGGRLRWLVVGVGINADTSLSGLPNGATSLRAELDGGVARCTVAHTLLERFSQLADDPDAILPAWRERTNTLGRCVRVETADSTVEGVAVDVIHPGALVVDTASGRRTVHTGDCTHLRRAGDDASQDD